MDFLQEYTEKVFNGEIIAGTELKRILKILKADRESGKYIFDTKYSELRIEFIETFCRQGKAPFYNKTPKLMLWQKAFLTALYSFYRKDENGNKGLLRFQKALLLIARKNGKSALASFDGFTELTIGQGGQFICCGSNDDKQASLIFNEVKGLSKRAEKTPKRFHCNLTTVKNNKNDNEVFKMSARTRDKDGRQISKAFLDEIHNARDNELYMSIWQSMSIAEEPLLIMLTTEGFVNGGLLDKELNYVRNILRGEIEDDTYLAFLYTQDSENEIWQDKRTWLKSNPSLNVVKKASYLEANLNKAKIDKETRMHVLCKDFNIHQNNAQSWLMYEDYSYKTKHFELEELRGAYMVCGVDLSSTTDMTAVQCVVMKPNDNTKYIVSKYFIPERKLYDSDDKTAGAKYEEWAQQGLVHICEGNEVDTDEVVNWLEYLVIDCGINLFKCGYDVRLSKSFVNAMITRLDGKSTLEIIPQAAKFLSEPTKLLEADLKARIVNYNENPVNQWCFSNAQIKLDQFGRIMIIKIQEQARRRIDGAVALVIAYATLRMYKTEFDEYLKLGGEK